MSGATTTVDALAVTHTLRRISEMAAMYEGGWTSAEEFAESVVTELVQFELRNGSLGRATVTQARTSSALTAIGRWNDRREL